MTYFQLQFKRRYKFFYVVWQIKTLLYIEKKLHGFSYINYKIKDFSFLAIYYDLVKKLNYNLKNKGDDYYEGGLENNYR